MLLEDRHIKGIMDASKKQALRIKLGRYEDDAEFLLFLKAWWSKHYNRPIKDPLLDEYSLYDLFFEYHINTGTDKDDIKNDVIDEHKDELEDLFKDFDTPKDKAPKSNVPQNKEEEEFLKKAFPEEYAKKETHSDNCWSMSEEDFR